MLMCVGVVVISPEMEAGGGDILKKKVTRFFYSEDRGNGSTYAVIFRPHCSHVTDARGLAITVASSNHPASGQEGVV